MMRRWVSARLIACRTIQVYASSCVENKCSLVVTVLDILDNFAISKSTSQHGGFVLLFCWRELIHNQSGLVGWTLQEESILRYFTGICIIWWLGVVSPAPLLDSPAGLLSHPGHTDQATVWPHRFPNLPSQGVSRSSSKLAVRDYRMSWRRIHWVIVVPFHLWCSQCFQVWLEPLLDWGFQHTLTWVSSLVSGLQMSSVWVLVVGSWLIFHSQPDTSLWRRLCVVCEGLFYFMCCILFSNNRQCYTYTIHVILWWINTERQKCTIAWKYYCKCFGWESSQSV